MDYTITAKVKLSIIADSSQEADNLGLEYLMGIMSMQEVEILDIEENPDDDSL